MGFHTRISNLLKRQRAAGNLAQLNIFLLFGLLLAITAWVFPYLPWQRNLDQATYAPQGSFDVYMKQSLGDFGGPSGESPWIASSVFDAVGKKFPFVLQTRAQRYTLLNMPAALKADWAAEDPRVAVVDEISDELNSITILAPGETRVMVSAMGVRKTLYISAAYLSAQCNEMRVIISESAQPELKEQMCQVVLPLVIQ
jgi:hypothetical protein